MRKLFACSVLSSLALAGCASSSEDDLLSPSAPAPSASVTIAAPATVSPSIDEQWGWLEQPVVLTVTNAAVTGTSATPVTYEFDIASDEGFTQMIHRASGVAQDAGGRTKTNVPRLPLPGILYYRVRATNGTASSPYSPTVRFDLEGQGGHISPNGYHDPSGSPLSEEYAEAILYGVGEEFPHTLQAYPSELEAELYAEELLLRYIWHLKLVGFDAARQRNPSGAISRDKFNIFIRGTWRTYDIFALGLAGVPTRITGLGRVTPENPQFDNGIPD